MRVRDIMTRSVVTTTPATPVKDAAVVLVGHRVTLLPVLDETDRLVGVLTEADVVRGRIPPDLRRGAWQGSQAGPPPPTTVGAPDRRTVHVQQGSVTITDQHADHHVALVLAQAVPGVVHAEVEYSTTQRT